MDALQISAQGPVSHPELRFDSDDTKTLLMRPVGQIALVKGLV